MWNSWPPTPNLHRMSHLFHDSRHGDLLSDTARQRLPVHQRREMEMTGWGDDITQYDVVQSMMKLNPAQIMSLYEHAITKPQIELYVSNVVGGDWFWNNGQTFLDTWTGVLHKRGLAANEVRDHILQGFLGIAINQRDGDGRNEASRSCSP